VEFSFKVEGLDGIGRASEAVRRSVVKELQKGLFVSAKWVEADAKQSILSGDKHGRVYKRGKTVSHRASAPGEAPASDAGRLVNSVNAEAVSNELAAEVHAGGGVVNYARALEFGTAKMAARPFFQPAAEKNRRRIADRLAKAVRDGLAKGKP
jgi:HK97 gp10 family phage protein